MHFCGWFTWFWGYPVATSNLQTAEGSLLECTLSITIPAQALEGDYWIYGVFLDYVERPYGDLYYYSSSYVYPDSWPPLRQTLEHHVFNSTPYFSIVQPHPEIQPAQLQAFHTLSDYFLTADSSASFGFAATQGSFNISQIIIALTRDAALPGDRDEIILGGRIVQPTLMNPSRRVRAVKWDAVRARRIALGGRELQHPRSDPRLWRRVSEAGGVRGQRHSALRPAQRAWPANAQPVPQRDRVRADSKRVPAGDPAGPCGERRGGRRVRL
jgi:hypothetical protein